MKRFIAIGGPTGSGKSSLAMELAPLINGEIVSCDSMQIYRGLDIGTAKPSVEDREKVTHWMLDIKDPSERYSVADYVADAGTAIEDINSRGRTAIVCGGTGLYMSSLLAGTVFSEEVPRNEQLREELSGIISEQGTESLISEIIQADPEYGGRLKKNDRSRIIRAVEIIRSGHTPSEMIRLSHGEMPQSLRILVNCSSREELYRRIEARCDRMLETGILEEAKYVFDNRESFTTAAAAIGYKEFFSYLEGRDSLQLCLDELKKATRHYAKRQLTWFRRENGFRTVFSDLDSSEKIAADLIKVWKEDPDSESFIGI